MERGLFGQELTLSEQLKASTFTAHGRLQTASFFEALAACQLPMESYVGYLRAMMTLHGVIEQAAATSEAPAVTAVWRPDLTRRPFLEHDLRFFEPRGVLDLREAVDEAQKGASALRLASLERPFSIIGWLYVLEGSTLGASVLRPMAARALLLRDDEGLSYFQGHGAEAPARWAGFRRRLDALSLDPAARQAVLQGANELFACIERICRGLHPVRPESRVRTLSALNPEAGRHAVPDDPTEVEAALEAADLCWRRYPYYESRYGDRGRRFAHSDGAWIVTLTRYGPGKLLQQVRWLGRILAARGMPTRLLETKLELLATALSQRLPERAGEFAAFASAAGSLREARQARIPDDAVAAIAAEFDRAVGPDWSVQFPDTGALIAWAVADEAGEFKGAVQSLTVWLADPTRFPPVWIEAVNQALAASLAACRSAPT